MEIIKYLITNTFYLFALFFLIYELQYLFNVRVEYIRNITLKRLSKEHHAKTLSEAESEEFKKMVMQNFGILVLSIIFILGGLLTEQWVLYLIYIILVFAVIEILKRISKSHVLSIFLVVIDTVAGILLSLFVIINHYHLHINTTDWVSHLINN